jgi:hypothetical protein
MTTQDPKGTGTENETNFHITSDTLTSDMNENIKICRYSDSQQAGRSGNPIPVTAKFSAPGPGTNPDSYSTMGSESLFRR